MNGRTTFQARDLGGDVHHQILSAEKWNTIIASLPGAHLLQTWEWALVKARFGWQPFCLVWDRQGDAVACTAAVLSPSSPNSPSSSVPFLLRSASSELLPRDHAENPVAAALILQRTIPVRGLAARVRMLYAPKGPCLDWNDAALRRRVLDDLRSFTHQQGAFFIKIDPDVRRGIGIPGTPDAQEDTVGNDFLADLRARAWHLSGEQIQFANTVYLDLEPDEAGLLARMKPKSRYNIRLAERKGVSVRPGHPSDYPLLYRMYAETSIRDGFVIRDEAYYRTVWETFSPPTLVVGDRPIVETLIAEVEGEPVAAVMIFHFAHKAWYIYGMSHAAHREKMPNHLLQWEAIRRAKAAGCKYYDLWGAPDEFVESDPLWGVYRFKEGLGGTVIRHIGAWDLPVNPLLYRVYTELLPRVLSFMRRRGQRRQRSPQRTPQNVGV